MVNGLKPDKLTACSSKHDILRSAKASAQKPLHYKDNARIDIDLVVQVPPSSTSMQQLCSTIPTMTLLCNDPLVKERYTYFIIASCSRVLNKNKNITVIQCYMEKTQPPKCQKWERPQTDWAAEPKEPMPTQTLVRCFQSFCRPAGHLGEKTCYSLDD